MSKNKMTPSKPVGTGATRLKFDNKPSIWPADDAAKKNPALETKLFGPNALRADIPASGEYAAKSKKGFYNEGTFEHEMPNTLLPTESY